MLAADKLRQCTETKVLLVSLYNLYNNISFLQEDPTLERHFKGHRDTITSIDFSPNMKQLGIQVA